MARRPEPISRTGGLMFGSSTGDTLAPHPKGGGFHLLSHERDHILFPQTELVFDRFERCAIFPGHFNNPIDLSDRQFIHTAHAAQLFPWLRLHERSKRRRAASDPMGACWSLLR